MIKFLLKWVKEKTGLEIVNTAKLLNFQKEIDMLNYALTQKDKALNEKNKNIFNLTQVIERLSPEYLMLLPLTINEAIDVYSAKDIFMAKKKPLFENSCKAISRQDKVFFRNLYCYLRFNYVLQGMSDESAKKQICVFFTYLIPLNESSLRWIAEFELYLQTETEEGRKL